MTHTFLDDACKEATNLAALLAAVDRGQLSQLAVTGDEALATVERAGGMGGRGPRARISDCIGECMMAIPNGLPSTAYSAIRAGLLALLTRNLAPPTVVETLTAPLMSLVDYDRVRSLAGELHLRQAPHGGLREPRNCSQCQRAARELLIAAHSGSPDAGSIRDVADKFNLDPVLIEEAFAAFRAAP